MLSDYEVISFDAGGTLFRPFPSVGEIYSRTALRYGCRAGAQEIEERFHELWHHNDTQKRLGPLNEKIEKEWWKRLVTEVFGQFEPVSDFDAFFEELHDLFSGPDCWQLFPETLDVLRTLKERGKRLCIISNWDSRLLKLCEGLGLTDYFDFILASAVFGASKPGERIFLEALRLAGVESSAMIHVGDSLEDDIEGAQGAGMAAVLVDRRKRSRAHPERFKGVRIVGNLSELI